jgi:PPOX class probable F420-dependent enzyme
MFDEAVRRYLAGARVGRLATADVDGRPHAVPVCFALVDDAVVTPIDEKPKAGSPETLRRRRDVAANPRVALVVDHYTEEWSRLGWVQVRGTAAVRTPDDPDHGAAVAALRAKYDQYASHALEERPVIRIEPGSVLTWGELRRPGDRTADGE